MSIVVDSVNKTFEGRKVLKDISLEVGDGSFLTLLGASDAGKTTLLRVMAGIDQPDRGRILYDGEDVTRKAVQKRPVAMVYQQFVNYPSMTIYENIASPLRIARKKYSKQEIDKRVKENAEMLGLSQVLDHYPEEVSGGQKQRTAIARALTKGAKFIFLDEPLANLDYKLREELRGELKNILRQKGGVVVYATPEPVDALTMATHVAYIQDGAVLQFGLVEEVYRHPRMADVGAYFSYPTMNIIEAQRISEDGRTWLKMSEKLQVDVTGFREKLQNDEYLVGVRAYNFCTQCKNDCMLPLKATVELSEELGSDMELHLNHMGITLVVLTQEHERHSIGTEIDLFVDPNRLYIYDKVSRELVLKTFTE